MDELFKKYSILNLEQRKMIFPDITNNEEAMYREFLAATDHIPNKIIEGLLEDLASATLTNFLEVLFNFLKTVRVEYKEVLQYRKFARSEVSRLTTQTETEVSTNEN